MATSTPKLQLVKPAGTDFVDVVTQLDNNYDTIDANIGAFVCTSSTRPSAPYDGQLIFETDTGDLRVRQGTSWLIVSHTGAWKTYSVTWAGGTVAVGNGTLTGKYIKIGRFITVQVNLLIGSTTNIGSSLPWTFSIPEDSDCVAASDRYLLNSMAVKAAPSTVYSGISNIDSSNTIVRTYFNNTSNNAATFTSAAWPFSWANGDSLNITGTYQANND